MTGNLYLPDSNIFIDSYRVHHPFDYEEFHPFWHWLERLAIKGRIAMVDSVYHELVKGKFEERDQLGKWVESVFGPRLIAHRQDPYGRAYAEVQDYLVDSGLYTPRSRAYWERGSKADPWLIAVAQVADATIVTNETAVDISPGQQMSREPKIPNVAEALGVRTMNLRRFYDTNGLLRKLDYPVADSSSARSSIATQLSFD